MKTTLRASLLTAGIILGGLSTSSLAGEIPEYVDINLQASNPALASTTKDRKNVPGFTHAKHATLFVKNNKGHAAAITSPEQSTCVACHEGVGSGEDLPSVETKKRQFEAVTAAGGIKKYMHALCVDCHKSMKKEAIATGPTSCKGCHNPQ